MKYKKYKIYPWIPIIGILLVFLNLDKTLSIEEPITFFGSAILQSISLASIIIYLL
jgi:energy-converting hydrogenase Eha subunit E